VIVDRDIKDELEAEADAAAELAQVA
jgi:hypothetical protein